MGMKPNLVQGRPMAKKANSPAPLAKTTRQNVSKQTPMSKPKNRPAPYAKNREASTYRANPTNTAPKMGDDARIRSELMSGGRSNSHSRGGK